MDKLKILLVALVVASLALAGCLEGGSGKGQASASALAGSQASPSPVPVPTAAIPEDLLKDDLDLSIAELEIVG